MNERMILNQVAETVKRTQAPKPVKKAWELLDHPSKWMQGCMARDRRGEPVSSRDQSAVSWCAIGAIALCYGPGRWVDKYSFLQADLAAEAEIEDRQHQMVDEWNDSSDYETVVAKLKELDI
jgi:hypothetical protein